MLSISSFLGICVALPALVVCSTALYNTYLHPLGRYPGPFLWTSFRLPYVVATYRGQLHRRLTGFHAKYGSIVRIAPNELSYTDAQAWPDIYSSQKGRRLFERNRTWFRRASASEPHSIMSYDEDAHSKFRSAYLNSFSDRSLRDQAPTIESYADLFVLQLKRLVRNAKSTSPSIDLNQWFNYFTFDVAGDLSFGESFDCLQNRKAHLWVDIAQDFGKGLALIASLNLYSPLSTVLRCFIPKQVIQRVKNHQKMSAERARQRLSNTDQRPDFVTPAKWFSDKKALRLGSKWKISPKEWEINMAVIVFAASETTASALTAIVRELVQNGDVIHTLTQEVRSAFEDESGITMASTKSLPYLNAVIEEGLRLNPPVAIGIPRVVPPGGEVVCGRWVAGGTYVAFNQFPAYRQSCNFRDPHRFLPERFLHPDPDTDCMSSFHPFSVGRHSCIGMKLAYAEMRLIVARLLWAFDIRLKDETDQWDWGEQDTFVLWEKRPLQVTLTQALRTQEVSGSIPR